MRVSLDKSGEALADLDKAIAIDPNNPVYYRLKGSAHYQLQNDKAACDDWQQAKSLGDEKVDYYLKQYCN
jgi:tetratricopeptide (TPR) repeat protein